MVRLKLDIVSGKFAENVKRWNFIIARTATLSMDQARTEFLDTARPQIANAGRFSRRWQTGLRAKRFPERRVSMGPSVYIYHKIPYADIFEQGGEIRGNPLLWIPLSSTPKKVGRYRMTPKNLVDKAGVNLVSIKSKSGKPLIGAPIRVPKTRAKDDRIKVTLAALKRGDSAQDAKGNPAKGIIRTVPLFVGVRAIHLRKRFDIARVTQNVRDKLPSYYAQNFRDD